MSRPESKRQIWNGQAVDWHEVVAPRRDGDVF